MRTTPYNIMLRDFATMANAMNRAFEQGVRPYDYARNGGHTGTANSEQAPNTLRLPLDVVASDEAFTLTAYVPGVNPDQVEITFEGEALTIRGEFPQAEGEFVKRELYHGPFERRVTFNVPVNADAIEATYEHGVLTLRVPKAEAIRPKQIKVMAK
ncbi:MAG: Hsp20/alpha crystallin family protein [Caldilineaceae bacterium]